MHRFSIFKAFGLGASILAVHAFSLASELKPNVNVGMHLAATCANCHGTDGQPQKGTFMPLAGFPAPQLVEILGAYKSGTRTGTVMHQIAKGYTDDQIALIAAYFASLKK